MEMLKTYQLIQLLMLALQPLPGMKAILRWCYFKTLDAFLKSLKEQQIELHSVYIKGSLARAEAVYGLSDIDLFLVMRTSLTPVQVAERVEGIRKSCRFRIIGELEILTHREVKWLQDMPTLSYTSLYDWRHYQGEEFGFLSAKQIASLEVRLGFACFQYLYYSQNLRQPSNLLSEVKARRLLTKILSRLDYKVDTASRAADLEDLLLRRMTELAGGLPDAPEVLTLTGLYPFTCLFEGASFTISSNSENKIKTARPFLDVTVRHEWVALTQKLLTPCDASPWKQDLYSQLLFFQKFGMLVNLMGHPLRGENTHFVLAALLSEAQSTRQVCHQLKEETIQFCEAAITELKKST